jgi:Phage integrase family
VRQGLQEASFEDWFAATTRRGAEACENEEPCVGSRRAVARSGVRSTRRSTRDGAGRRGLGLDYVFTTATGQPMNRLNISRRGVQRAAEKAGLGHVTAQTLRRSVATATAHAGLPAVVAAAMTGHSKEVYSNSYARPFRDAEERERVRVALAGIGFGNVMVDQPLTNDAIEDVSGAGDGD